MPRPLRIESGELIADEILDALRESHRVVIQAELLGGAHEVMLHHGGMVFYCGMPATPHRHKDEDGTRAYVLKMGCAKRQRRCGSRPRRPLVHL